MAKRIFPLDFPLPQQVVRIECRDKNRCDTVVDGIVMHRDNLHGGNFFLYLFREHPVFQIIYFIPSEGWFGDSELAGRKVPLKVTIIG